MPKDSVELASRNLQEVQDLLRKSEERIAAQLPKHIRADRMIAVTLELVAGDSKLKLCTPQSVLLGVLEASQLGLLLMKNLGHGYLVPYRNGMLSKKYEQDVFDAKFIIGYRGLIDLVLRGDEDASNVFGRIVYPEEHFEIYEGTRHELIHRPDPKGAFPYQREGEPCYLGAYAVVIFGPDAQGRVRPSDFEWLPCAEVEKIRRISKAQSTDSPWFTFPEEMIKKTAIRRLCKRLRLNPDILAATVRDEYRELGVEDSEERTYTLTDTDYEIKEPQPKKKLESEPGVNRSAEKQDGTARIKGEYAGKVTAALRDSGKTPQQLGDYLEEKYKTRVLTDIALVEVDDILKWIGAPKSAANGGKPATDTTKEAPSKGSGKGIGKARGRELDDLAYRTGWNALEWGGFVAKTWGISDVADLPAEMYDTVKKAAEGNVH
jgi:recombination protein RecT